MKKKWFLLLSSVVMVIGCTGMGSTVFAQEGGNGGQVQTNGQVAFYEDEPAPSSSSEPLPSSTSSIPAPAVSSSEAVTKPAGKYPSTGELVKKSLSISGAALVGIVLFFLYKRRKKEAGE